MSQRSEQAVARSSALRRRWLLAGAALIGASGLLPAPASAAERIVPIQSGLPWASGAFISEPTAEFAAWRGNRKPDVETMFFGMNTWDHIRKSASAIKAKRASVANRLIVALAMVPRSHEGQLEACAAGTFDAQINAVASAMLANGGQAAVAEGKPIIVRLGWEANNTNGDYPWRATGDGTSWRDCFKRWVDVLNPVTNAAATPPTRQKNFVIVWNMANRGTFEHPIENLWPGNDYVDIVGSQYYDRCPPLPGPNADPNLDGDREWWFKRLTAKTGNGNPAGPKAWLEFAKAKGKPYAIPEWGIGGPRDIPNCAVPGTDNAFFMQQMYRFLWWNAADIAFESYFNGHGYGDGSHGSHKLFSPGGLPVGADYLTHAHRFNPSSAAKYRELWGAGLEPQRPLEPPAPWADTLKWVRYIASFNDTVTSLGTSAESGYTHYTAVGAAEGRRVTFDPVRYLSRNPGVRALVGSDGVEATKHFITTGYNLGYTWSNTSQYWLRYLASNPDLIPTLGALPSAAELHYYQIGKTEGRQVNTFNPVRYLRTTPAARTACGTNQACAVQHFVANAPR